MVNSSFNLLHNSPEYYTSSYTTKKRYHRLNYDTSFGCMFIGNYLTSSKSTSCTWSVPVAPVPGCPGAEPGCWGAAPAAFCAL